VNGITLNFDAVAKGIHISNEDQAVFDIHDYLKAYYKVALKRFTDNIVLQVTERIILGPEGAVKLLCPDYVGDLGDNELMDLAGESFATSSLRNELVAKSEKFKAALVLARKEAM
jgi:hypothetical protein